MYSFFYGSSHLVPLPAYDLEVVHCCCVAISVFMFKYWWGCFQMFFVSLSKGSRWLPYVFIITFSFVMLEPVYYTALHCYHVLVLWKHQEIFQSLSSFEMHITTIFSKGSRWLPYVFIITFSFVTLELVYNTALHCYHTLVLWKHQDIFQSLYSFEMHVNTIFAIDSFVALTKTLWIWYNYVALLSTWGAVGFCFVLLDFCLSSCFRRTLFTACLGYLHLIRTSSRWFHSFLSS